MRRLFIICVLLLVVCVPGLALAQDAGQDQSTESLADIARKLKEKQGQTTPSVKGKVFTNDDVSSSREKGGVSEASSTKATSEAESGGAHGEKYYRKAYAKLLAKKELDQRQLDVLQKKLNQNDVQYYNDPQKALQQQYTREDINKNQDDLNKKKADVAADDQAIQDLQDQLRADGGDPSWLSATSASIEPDVDESASKVPAGEKDKKQTKEFWQSRFKAARATLAKAQEAQKLVEDEMNFLKVRQVQEKSDAAQADIKNQMDQKQTELDSATAVTEKAQQALDSLQKAFDDSGAPAEWSQVEESSSSQ